jgi:hypothetical protein
MLPIVGAQVSAVVSVVPSLIGIDVSPLLLNVSTRDDCKLGAIVIEDEDKFDCKRLLMLLLLLLLNKRR